MDWDGREAPTTRLRRMLRMFGIATGTVALGFTGLYGIHLGTANGRVLREFEALANNAYYHVLAEPLRLRVGMDLRAAGFVNPVKLEQEVCVEEGAAEFAVGHALETKVFLHLHHIGNCRILGQAERRLVDGSGLESCAGFEQRLGAQEAADVVGAERSGGHAHSPVLLFVIPI